MPDQSSSRMSLGAAALLLLIASVILAPLGMFAFEVVAQVMGGNNPPRVLVSPDPLSDSVSATAAEFRVDETGAATYTVPLYTARSPTTLPMTSWAGRSCRSIRIPAPPPSSTTRWAS